ncbi:hypothetical protein CPT_Sansa105 [Caulobacter phage Sansa]|uniref:Uncharacterized protein n=1 Tax=Caulobacter phage Sansa TaxID=1675600 RepID=A0A0K1LM26_9CAUD|nr:hypothetical protein HOR07_gp105 [Caulobacter phage Sansa]AKU43509.1 hypothetical protein CPT_Sansa105 [Caulobacter phage Sansa]
MTPDMLLTIFVFCLFIAFIATGVIMAPAYREDGESVMVASLLASLVKTCIIVAAVIAVIAALIKAGVIARFW